MMTITDCTVVVIEHHYGSAIMCIALVALVSHWYHCRGLAITVWRTSVNLAALLTMQEIRSDHRAAQCLVVKTVPKSGSIFRVSNP